MVDTVSFDEAAKCPKCKHTGETVSQRPAQTGNGTVFTLECKNKVCPWYETTWIVQRKPDGTVPIRDEGPMDERERMFPKVREGEKLAEMVLEQISKEETVDESPEQA